MNRTPTSLDDFLRLAAEDCVNARGSAADPDSHRRCRTCGGTGVATVSENPDHDIQCPVCDGSGERSLR